MKTEEIDAMPAGRELDCLVARQLFGLVVRQGDDEDWPDWYSGTQPGVEPTWGDSAIVPRYSTYISATWLIVEKLNPKHPLIMTFRPTEKDWWVMLPNEAKHPKGRLQHGPDCMVQAFTETSPLAICRAALKTVEVKVNDR